MGEFSWAYINANALLSASGPTGSIQFRVSDHDGRAAISGSHRFIFHTASNLVAVTGNVEISGTLTANQYNINVVDKTVTNLFANGNTVFGDTSDDTHQFTGSIFSDGSVTLGNAAADVIKINGQLTASSQARVNGDLRAASNFTVDANTVLGEGSGNTITVKGTTTHEADVLIQDDKKLKFGTNSDAAIEYDENGRNKLIISGSEAGIEFTGSAEFQNAVKFHDETQFNNTVKIIDDTKLLFGTNNDASIEYDENGQNRLIISGSTTGLEFQGRTIVLDQGAGKAVHSGTVAGMGSYLALNTSNEVILAPSVKINNDANNRITTAMGDNNLNAEANLTFDGTNLVVTGSLTVTGSALGTSTVINGTHVSSSLNISGSEFHVGRYIRHAGDSDTFIDFTNDDINIQAGGVNFIDITQDSTNEITFNEEGADINFRVEGDNDTHLLFVDGGKDKIAIGTNSATHLLTVDGDISASLGITGSAFYGDGSNLTNIPASAVGAAGADNQIQFNDDNDLAGNANLIFRGNSDLVLTGSLILTGSSQSLIVLDTRDADNLKEIVFNKDGSAAAAIQINSSEHLFIENENVKDIILRTNNQNALRVVGSQRKVIVGAVSKTAANAELDVEGSAMVSGSLTVSGSSTIGLGTNHQSTFGGGLTASLGISLGQNSFVATDKNILFGSQGNSAIQYNNSAAQLVISGSSGGSGGINFQGNNIQFDIANGTIKTGSLAGGKSYLGVDTNGRLVLTGSVEADVAAAGSDEQIQFNNGGAFGASANLTFDDTYLASSRAIFGTTAATLTVAAGELSTLSNIDSGSNKYTGQYDAIGKLQGHVITLGASPTVGGQLYYLSGNGTWHAAQADDEDDGGESLLAVAVNTNSSTHGMLRRGTIRITGSLVSLPDEIEIGMPVYVSKYSAGQYQFAPPTGSGEFVRRVGYCIDKNGSVGSPLDFLLLFEPSDTFVEIA